MEAALQGMLASLDPHSSYMSASEFRDMRQQARGEYNGLGVEVTIEDGVVRVVSPIDDTPAARAGIQAGDYFTAINGESIVGLTLNDAVQRMRGEAGSSITVTIAREGVDPFDVTIVRQVINVRAVTARVEGGDVGIIRISTFNNERAGTMLQDAIRTVRRDAGGNLRGVVLDLRNNPGGLLDQAVEVSDAFLDGGEVVSTRGRHPEDVQRYNARRGDDLAGVPVVVLINGASASASEIVAGALQDRGRAIVVGTDSFGKGSVQTLIPLQGGRDGALRLTTARYYTPAGRSIQGAGITPDMEVAARRVNAADLPRGISEADLPNALDNDSGTQRRAAHVPEDQPPEDWTDGEDYQLARAMEFLRRGVIAERLRARAG
jgi:carboxyl-terminal processing protease